jgi:uncharacterized protein (DUF433 family)
MVSLRKIAARLRNRKFAASEAAAMLNLSVPQVNNLIDEVSSLGIAEKGNGKRWIEYRGLFTLLMASDLIRWQLAKELRIEALTQALSKNTKRVEANAELSVLVTGYREKAQRGLSALYEAEENVTSSNEIMQGELCLRGTRVSVYVLAAIAEKQGIEGAKRTYSFLSETQIEYAVLYARAHPRKGRPKATSIPSAPTSVTRKIIVRNKQLESA